MNNHLKILILVIIAVLALYLIPTKTNETSEVVVDFHSCEEAGGEILEIYPQQCRWQGKTFTEDLSENPEVVVETPKPGDLVTSPLVVKGQARGYWFFEANLPITLKDENGKILAQQGFQAIGDWITNDYVRFEGTLDFANPETEFGVLIIEKDNPSGLSEFDASFAVPVRFR